MADHNDRRTYTKLVLAHLCAGIVEGLLSGAAAALPHLMIGGLYLHLVIAPRRPHSGGDTGPSA